MLGQKTDAAPTPVPKIRQEAPVARPEEFFVLDSLVMRFEKRQGLGYKLGRKLNLTAEHTPVLAVNNVSLTLPKGQALGLVGESGSGKSTLGRMAAGIYVPTEGSVLLDGAAVMSAQPNARKITTRVQMIFQDPFASLNPRMTIGQTVAEGPIAHGLTTKATSAEYVARWLTAVGLDPAFASRYPHQFSGGQRQRVAIARALAMQPDAIICDEPVASLDVAIQAQIINLLLRLRRELNLTLLFISHDLSVVRHLCDRVAVMYRGQIVEEGEAEAVYTAPQHDYTKMLLNAVPKLAG